MLVATSACRAQAGAASAADVVAGDSRVRYIGRFDARRPDAQRFSWPGTQIEATFTGSLLRAEITDTPIEDDPRETDWLTVVIDDDEPHTVPLREGRHVYTFATGLSSGPHRVSIWKRTEADVGVITFHGFSLEHGHSIARGPKPPARQLEVVGDSISAGYGNEGPDGLCHWSAERENNYLTYGAIAARELKADYTAIAWSGKGLARNYDPRDSATLPQLYDAIVPTDASAGVVGAGAKMDAVIVNLGTNDVFAGPTDGTALRAAYTALLTKLRQRYPGALLVIAFGPMLSEEYPWPKAQSVMRGWLKRVEADWRAQQDERIDFIELSIDPDEGLGCDSHPNIKSHARFGRELAALLRTRLAW